MSALPLCRDCRHFMPSREYCANPKNLRPDFIHGKPIPRNTIDYLRGSVNCCGESARWFEPKKGA